MDIELDMDNPFKNLFGKKAENSEGVAKKPIKSKALVQSEKLSTRGEMSLMEADPETMQRLHAGLGAMGIHVTKKYHQEYVKGNAASTENVATDNPENRATKRQKTTPATTSPQK